MVKIPLEIFCNVGAISVDSVIVVGRKKKHEKDRRGVERT